MKTNRFLFTLAILLLATFSFATDEEGEILLADLEGIKLTLDGAPHYYWLEPGKTRILLKRTCVPVPEDCDHEVIVAWDLVGQRIFKATPLHDLPEMSGNRVRSGTLLTPDVFAFSTVVRREDWTHVLGQYEMSSGKLEHVVPISPIRCRDLTGDTDGVLWCFGDHQVKRSKNEDYDLVYRFDHGGKLRDSTLPRSTFPEKPHPLVTVRTQSGYGGFLPGDGPVRLWLPDLDQLISFDEDGQVAERVELPAFDNQRRAWLVTAPDDAVYALLIAGEKPGDSRDWTQALYHLAPDNLQWIPLHDPPILLPLRIRLVGADDTGLILLDRQTLELLWYPYEAFEIDHTD